MTSFTRIIIVLSILRQALGLAQTPPNQVLIGLSLFLTFFVMSPALNQINETAFKPYAANTMPIDQAVEKGGAVLHTRSEEHTSELQSLMRISYAVFCLKKKKKQKAKTKHHNKITIV